MALRWEARRADTESPRSPEETPMRKLMLPLALLQAGLWLAAPALGAPPTGNVANERLDAKGKRIEHRLDARGDRIDHRLDVRAKHAMDNGHPLRAKRLDAKGDRIDHRL